MKTFEDLKFTPHPAGIGIHAKMDFPNGYGVSVIQGPLFYSKGPNEYEAAVTDDGALCYDSGITDDVLVYLSKEEVTDLMKKIQSLEKSK